MHSKLEANAPYKNYRYVLVEQSAGVLTITLNRPEKRNAMGVGLTLEMVDLLEQVTYDANVRVVVLTGAGDSFCAGMDLKDFFDASEHDEMTLRRAQDAANLWRVRLLRNLPQPTIAMVNGHCFGGGFSIVEACDIAFADEQAKLAISEINFGHFTGGPVAKSVRSTMTSRSASYYALSGRGFSGAEAVRTGFITQAFSKADLHRETYQLARELAEKDPVALHLTKESLRFAGDMSWDAALSYNVAKAAELSVRQQGDTSRASSINAFLGGKLRPGLSGSGDAGDSGQAK